MNQVTQQTPPTPAQRLAAKIRARTNDTRAILNLLHDIAEGGHDATEHDKLTATGILFDRGYGKCPKSAPDASPAPNLDPETDDDDVEPAPYSIRGAIRESPPAAAHKEPESPRLVSQLDDSLHESLGPAPGPCPEPVEGAQKTARHSRESGNPESPDPFDDPSSIQSIIREHIISITNDGDTLIDVLMDIAWADDPGTKPFHRNKAGKMLLDRGAGTDPTPVLRAVRDRPEPSESITYHPDYPPGYIPDPTKDCIYCSPTLDMPEGHEGEHRFDEEVWKEIIAELKQKEEAGILTPDPNYVPRDDLQFHGPPPDWIPHPDLVRKEAAEFRAKLDLQIERQKQWPEIEERRRKKLAQIYPSHSENEPPDT